MNLETIENLGAPHHETLEQFRRDLDDKISLELIAKEVLDTIDVKRAECIDAANHLLAIDIEDFLDEEGGEPDIDRQSVLIPLSHNDSGKIYNFIGVLKGGEGVRDFSSDPPADNCAPYTFIAYTGLTASRSDYDLLSDSKKEELPLIGITGQGDRVYGYELDGTRESFGEELPRQQELMARDQAWINRFEREQNEKYDLCLQTADLIKEYLKV